MSAFKVIFLLFARVQDEVKGLTQERTEMWAAVRALQQEKKRMNATITDLQNALKKKKNRSRGHESEDSEDSDDEDKEEKVHEFQTCNGEQYAIPFTKRERSLFQQTVG